MVFLKMCLYASVMPTVIEVERPISQKHLSMPEGDSFVVHSILCWVDYNRASANDICSQIIYIHRTTILVYAIYRYGLVDPFVDCRWHRHTFYGYSRSWSVRRNGNFRPTFLLRVERGSVPSMRKAVPINHSSRKWVVRKYWSSCTIPSASATTTDTYHRRPFPFYGDFYLHTWQFPRRVRIHTVTKHYSQSPISPKQIEHVECTVINGFVKVSPRTNTGRRCTMFGSID